MDAVKRAKHAAYMRKWRYEHPEENKAYMREYRQKNPDKYLQYGRKYREKQGSEGYKRKTLRDNHGMSLEEYQTRVATQKEGCAICGQPNRNPRHFGLVVDHNHTTGVIRDLLCHACNLVVGWCREDTTILESTIAYLKKHQGRK